MFLICSGPPCQRRTRRFGGLMTGWPISGGLASGWHFRGKAPAAAGSGEERPSSGPSSGAAPRRLCVAGIRRMLRWRSQPCCRHRNPAGCKCRGGNCGPERERGEARRAAGRTCKGPPFARRAWQSTYPGGQLLVGGGSIISGSCANPSKARLRLSTSQKTRLDILLPTASMCRLNSISILPAPSPL